MGKKKAVLKKTFSENLEAGDALTQNESKTSDSREDTPTLRSQVDRMREHSTRLIAEYNRKLETLRRENFQLTEELQHSRKLLEAQSSTCQELAEDENKTKSDDQGSREVDHDCQAASNLDCIVNNIKQSFALIASLGAEIPKSKLKRDRIVDSAKRSVGSREEVFRKLLNVCTAMRNVADGDEQGEQSIIESLFDELVGTNRTADHPLLTGEDSDDNSVAIEWTTASSSEPWDHEEDSKLQLANLQLRQRELNELLISERNNYEEKLISLTSALEENIERSNALQLSLANMSKKCTETEEELHRLQGMYNDVVNELGMEKSDHARHSDLLRSAELEISQVKESARIIEEERSRLRLENAELVEKIRTVEVLQASEQRHSEELTQRSKSLEASLLREREHFLRQLEVLQKTLEENGEDSDFDTMTSNGNLVTSSEDCEDHEPSVNQMMEQFSLLKGNLRVLRLQKEENCEKLAQLTLKLSSTNEDLSSTKEKLEQAATQIVDLQTSYEAAQMEIKSSKEENSFLANRIREYEEMIRSAEEDLEKTRMAYADQKKENDDRRVQLDHVKRELDELQMTASEATILRERLVAVESELAESSQLNHHLRSQIDSQVSELNEQLLSKGQQISELEKTISAMEASSAETRARSATEVASLKKELAEANALVEKFSSELEVNSQVTAEEAREHVTAVKNAEANLKLVMEERDNVISELKNTKEQLHELEHDLSDALERCEVLTEEFNSERKKLQCELETARSAEESLVKELWKAEEESAAQNAIQEQMQEKMSRLLDESEALSLKMVEAAAQNEELMEEKESALKENMLLREEMQSIRDNLVAACVHRDELLMKVSNMEAINKMQENQSLSSATLEEHCASSGVVPATYKNESFSGSVVPEGQIIHNDEVVGLRERTKILEEELKFVRAEEKKLREQVGSLTEAVSTRESSLARYEVELVNLQVQLRERRERDTVTHLQSSVELKRSEETINHLRDDNVRLERELFLSHEQLECAKSEIIALQQSLERSEAIALTSRNDNQKLVEQLDRALFEKEQTLIMAGEGQEAAAKVIALERNIATLKSDYDEKLKQALEDLDSSEQQLRHLKDAAEQAYLQRDESFRKMESWRKRFELAAQEIESLIRSNEEVRHLEAALEKSRVEKSTLYEELSSQRSVLDRVLAEKDALLAQLAALNGQLDERTNRLRQAGEAKMDTTLRIVELESQIAALLREKDAVAGQEPGKSSNSGVNTDQSLLQMNSTQHVAVQIENEAELAEIERLRSDLRRAEQRIIELEEFERNVGDNHRSSLEASHSSEHVNISEWPHHFVSASTPLPSLITLLSRRLSALRHHPTRAIMPYFRYAMTVYAVVLHFMLIHCWFLAGCP
uniref:GRIP domain-containing protein n=1 Tax=Haemonchus contortus TaxID=6289 RepID=A0A7I4Y325_HAECO